MNINTDSVFEPLHDNIIIRPVDPEVQTEGGLVLPTTSTKPLLMGEVVAVGPGRRLNTGELYAPEVKVGQLVTIRSGGASVELGVAGQNLVLTRWPDILAVVHPAKIEPEG